MDRSTVKQAIANRHGDREINPGDADWLVRGLLTDGRRFEAVYDHPVGRDPATVLIVSVWDL